MNDETLAQVEEQLAGVAQRGAPRELRGAVLADVHRELRAAGWDRRLGRLAAVLLVAGVGLNAAVGLKSVREDGRELPLAQSNARQSLVDTAIVVAEATDARTGSRYARQMAAMIGHTLTADDAAAIDAAVRYSPPQGTNGNKG